jgi:hypothetical protein
VFALGMESRFIDVADRVSTTAGSYRQLGFRALPFGVFVRPGFDEFPRFALGPTLYLAHFEGTDLPLQSDALKTDVDDWFLGWGGDLSVHFGPNFGANLQMFWTALEYRFQPDSPSNPNAAATLNGVGATVGFLAYVDVTPRPKR